MAEAKSTEKAEKAAAPASAKHEHADYAPKGHTHKAAGADAKATADALRLLGSRVTFREEADAVAFAEACDSIAGEEG